MGNVRIYPNPITDLEIIEVEFEHSVHGAVRFTILDQIGNPYMVTDRHVEGANNKVTIDLSSLGLRPGIYFFRIQQDLKKEKVLKIIKK